MWQGGFTFAALPLVLRGDSNAKKVPRAQKSHQLHRLLPAWLIWFLFVLQVYWNNDYNANLLYGKC